MATKEDIRRVSIYINGDPADLTLKQLTATTNKLNNELRNLTPGTADFNNKVKDLTSARVILADVKEDINKIGDSMQKSTSLTKELAIGFEEVKRIAEGVTIGSIISLAVRGAIESIKEFGKELLDLEIKASGIERAFTRIGDTTGLIEKLRVASKGMLTDMDLEKMAVQANQFNVPLAKLPLLLEFAAQRARDTGKDVGELTEKLIEGLGKKGGKALVELGISTSEFNAEMKVTPDRIDAIANIIRRRMSEAGDDMDNFGDSIKRDQTIWENFKEKLAAGWKFVKDPWKAGGTNDEDIRDATNEEMKKFKGIESMKDSELRDAIKSQSARAKKLNQEATEMQKKYDEDLHSGTGRFDTMKVLFAKIQQTKLEAMAAQNALGALNNRSANLVTKEEENGKAGTANYFDKQIADLKKTQSELAKTSSEWKKYQEQIDKLTKQKQAVTGEPVNKSAIKKAESDRAAALKEFQLLGVEQKKFEAAELADTMAKNDKEVALLEKKYNDFIQKEKDFLKKKGVTKAEAAATNANIEQLEAERRQSVIDLRDRQERELADKIQGYRDKLNDKEKTQLEKEEAEINRFYDDLSKAAGENLDAQLTIENNRIDTLTEAKIREQHRFEDEKRKIEEEGLIDGATRDQVEVARLNNKFDQEIEALKKKFSLEFKLTKDFQLAIEQINYNRAAAIKQYEEKGTIEKNKKLSELEIRAAKQVEQGIFAIGQQNRAAETNAEIKNLENQKNVALNAAGLTAAQKAKINEDFAQKEAAVKLKAWKADQAAAIGQAIINGALAMTKVAAQTGVLSFAFDPIIAAETAIEVALIASRTPPAFAQGGYSAVDYSNPSGYVNRPTLFANSSSGRAFIAGEGNKTEYIVSSQQLRDPVVANFVGMMEANRNVRRFEMGGWSGGGNSSSTGTGSSSAGEASISYSSRLDRIEAILEKQAAFNELPITFNTKAHDIVTARNAQIVTKATL